MADFPSPYVSFVVAGRNDNYGGDFNYRLQNSIRWLSDQVEKYKLPAEYIVVNYNPVESNAPLREALNWPTDRKYLKLRIVTVPPEVHKTLEDPSIRDTVPLYEYIAKNVGVRRAEGEYICAANPDIIFHPKIIQSLAKRNLKRDHYYRVDRCDFNRIEVDGEFPPDFLKQLQKATFKVFLKGITYEHTFPSSFFEFHYWRLKRRNKKELKEKNRNFDTPPEFYYHCNCSGDFMMMHRDEWYKMNGHPENTLVAAHTDAMFVIMAAAAGLKEYVYPMPVFHQDHSRRYVCDDEEINTSVQKMYDFYEMRGRKMLAQGAPIIENDENWGLSKYTFDNEEF